MDAQRFKEAYERLDALDQRLTHKVRPRSTLKLPAVEQLAEQTRDLQIYVLEIKDVVRELFQAIAAKPPVPGG